MLLYEVTEVKTEKKHLVAAVDSRKAKFITSFETGISEENLRVFPANEDDARSRKVTVARRYMSVEKTAWEIFRECKKHGQEALITSYLF